MEFGPKMTEDEWDYIAEIETLSGQKVSTKAYNIYIDKYSKK